MKVLLLFILQIILINHTMADFYVHHWENHHEDKSGFLLNPEFKYYQTNTNFWTDGSSFIPANLNTYNRTYLDTNLAYGVGKDLTLFGRLSWAYIDLQHDTRSGNGFGLSDQTIGANYQIGNFKSGVSIYLQSQVDFGTYNNLNANSEAIPYLGDGSIDVTTGAFFFYPFNKKFILETGLGFTWRSLGYSLALPWSLLLKYSPTHSGLHFSFGILGVRSLKSDNTSVSSSEASSEISQDGAGGSFFINAVNPSLLQLKATVGYQFSPQTGVYLGGQQAITGSSAAKGVEILGGLYFHWGDAPIMQSNLQMTPKEYGKTNKGFINYAQFEGKVIRVNDRLNLIRVNKGSSDGIKIGDIFDIFSIDQNGSIGSPVARGRVTQIKTSESILTITEFYQETWVEEGYIIKKPLQ